MLVTGGGTGLGRAAAAELVRCGASVVICGRRSEVLSETASEIGAAWVAGGRPRESDAERLVDFVVGALRPTRRAGQQRRRAVLRAGRGDRAEGLAGRAPAERGGDGADVARGGRARVPAGAAGARSSTSRCRRTTAWRG